MINKIAITGGTHGNELTGVYLIKKWQKQPELVKRDSFETLLIHTNPKAIKECRRYIDKDLNRCFCKEILSQEPKIYEHKIAQKLNTLLGPKGSEKTDVDFIVDLHSTTANMGLSLVVSSKNKLTWDVVKYLLKKEPTLHVFRWLGDEEDSFVDSISPNGFAIEVGAIPQGVLRADLFEKSAKLVYHILDFFEDYNKGTYQEDNNCIEIYDHVKLLDYPRDEQGNITAMVHQDLQDRDYKLLKKGDPIFLTLKGENIYYEEEQPLYALFINEAAYYEKGFAMCLSRKINLAI